MQKAKFQEASELQYWDGRCQILMEDTLFEGESSKKIHVLGSGTHHCLLINEFLDLLS